MSNGFYQPQMIQQMPMQGYPQMPVMQQQGVPTADRINALGAQMAALDEQYKQLKQQAFSSQTAVQQSYAQPMQQQILQPQPEQGSILTGFTVVETVEQALNTAPDFTGKKQWFITKDEQIISKQFDPSTAKITSLSYTAQMAGTDESESQVNEQQKETQPTEPGKSEMDTMKDYVNAELASLREQVDDLKGRLKDVQSNGNISDDSSKQPESKPVNESGAADEPTGAGNRRNNRQSDSAKSKQSDAEVA